MNDVFEQVEEAEQPQREPARNPGSYTIVSQCKSNRVVYFTDDPDYAAPMDGDWYYISSYIGQLPKRMTLRNCWRWRFNGGVFIDAGDTDTAVSRKQSLIEHNRNALLQILNEKVDRMRAPYAASCVLGDAVRAKKIREAAAFLNGEALPSYPTLEAVAVARNIPLAEAARIVADSAAQADRVLEETEAVRETFTRAIAQAETEENLLEVREKLLNDVCPALTESFKFKTEHTRPPTPDAPLPNTQLRHEQVRLQVQLRERINAIRSRHVSRYVLDEVILKHKGKIAEALIAQGGRVPETLDISVLETYARARGLSLMDASREVLAELSDMGKVLADTEQVKDRILADIAKIVTLRDVKRVSAEIGRL